MQSMLPMTGLLNNFYQSTSYWQLAYTVKKLYSRRLCCRLSSIFSPASKFWEWHLSAVFRTRSSAWTCPRSSPWSGWSGTARSATRSSSRSARTRPSTSVLTSWRPSARWVRLIKGLSRQIRSSWKWQHGWQIKSGYSTQQCYLKNKASYVKKIQAPQKIWKFT